ncbi:MAG TPA: ATP-binding protein, partial [Nitrospiria bacterium]
GAQAELSIVEAGADCYETGESGGVVVFAAFRDLPIRRKLMRISMLVSISALTLASLGFIVYEFVTFRGTMVKSLATQAEIIGINTVSALLFNDPESAAETLAALRVKSNIPSAAVYAADGKLFARYVRGDGTTIFQLPERITELAAGHQFRDGYLFLGRPIVREGESIGVVYIQSDRKEMEARLQRYAGIVAVVLAISLLTAHRVSSGLQGRISGPILHLAETARTVSEEKNYSIRAVVESRDEVGQLVETFNEMLAQIQVREGALEKAHDELEQRVEERTRELQQEVAERQRAEEALSDQTRLLKSVLTSVGEGVVVADLNGKFTIWNPAAERIIGLGPANVPPEQWPEQYGVYLPDQVTPYPADRMPLARAIRGEPMDDDIQFLRHAKAPQGIWLSVSGRTLRDEQGVPIGGVVVFHDITERRRAEEEKNKLNTQLEATNKELEAFSYSVSHDLRAPLRHIDGFSQILLEDYAGKLDDEGQRHLKQVREASQQMAQLIDDLLNLSRVTRAEMRRDAVDLSRLAETSAEELKKTQPERKAEFVIAEALKAEGDARLLRAVLDNLLGNAWKYAGKQPQARIEFGRTNHDSRAAYFVRDNGAGFDMAYAHKLFGAFQRLHSVSEFPGTGIGLATVQRIIHRHGGQVWAEGEVDNGATFYFTL